MKPAAALLARRLVYSTTKKQHSSTHTYKVMQYTVQSIRAYKSASRHSRPEAAPEFGPTSVLCVFARRWRRRRSSEACSGTIIRPVYRAWRRMRPAAAAAAAAAAFCMTTSWRRKSRPSFRQLTGTAWA